MDYGEAAGATVDKLKFLLSRLFEKPQVPDEEEEEDRMRRHRDEAPLT